MKERRGVALIWVLILSTVLMITATTMVNYIVKESRFSIRIEESTMVYAAAKSGIDWGKWKMEPAGDASGTYLFDIIEKGDGNSETEVVIDEDNNLITSTSQYNNVTRKLKYTMADKRGDKLDLDKVNTALNGRWMGNNTESFEMQFDFWGGGAPYSIGVYANSQNRIYMDTNASGAAKIAAVADGVVKTSGKTFQVIPDANYYTYRAKIRYIKDTAVKVTVFKTDFSQNPPASSCVGNDVLDLTGLNFGNLSRLFLVSATATPVYVKNGMIEDGKYISINNQVFIDNIFASFIAPDLPSHTVTATATTGGSVSPSGANSYSEGSDVTLSASANTGLGYLFKNWSGATCPLTGSTIPTISFIAEADVTCVANFQRATIVTVKSNGAGLVAGGNTYWPGGIVTLTATANSGYAFSNWSGCSTSTANPLTYTVPSGDVICTANFYATVPVYYFIPGWFEYFYSTNSGETVDYKGVAWNSPSASFPGAVVVNRYIHTTTGRHMYLLGTESLSLPWQLEGPVWYAFQPSTANRKNICRYRHPSVGDAHLWSTYCSGGADYEGYKWEGPTFSVPY